MFSLEKLSWTVIPLPVVIIACLSLHLVFSFHWRKRALLTHHRLIHLFTNFLILNPFKLLFLNLFIRWRLCSICLWGFIRWSARFFIAVLFVSFIIVTLVPSCFLWGLSSCSLWAGYFITLFFVSFIIVTLVTSCFLWGFTSWWAGYFITVFFVSYNILTSAMDCFL